MVANLDMDVLRTFVAGVDLGSFAQASSKIGRSQSAVSAQLRKLEDQVGQRLLRKQGRHLALTETGEIVLGYARRLLDLNDEVLGLVRQTEVEGAVRLGLPQDFAEAWLPEVLGRFARRHPRVRIEVRCDGSDALRTAVAHGRLDLALTWNEPDGAHVEAIALLPMVWIGAAGDDILQRSSEPLPIVVFDPPCCFRKAGVGALDSTGRPWRLAFSSPSLAGLWAAVTAGLGVTLRTRAGLPASVRTLDFAIHGLPMLPAVSLDMHRAEAVPSTATERLAAILKEAVTKGFSS